MAAFYEANRYKVKITNQVLTENKKGNPELQLTVQPIAVYERGEFSEFAGPYERTVYITLTDGTIGTPDSPGWALQLLEFLGFNGQSFAQLDPADDNAISFIDTVVDARCVIDTYNGVEREKWDIIRPGRMTATTIDKKSIRALDAKFGKTLKSISKKQPVGAGVGDERVTLNDSLPPAPKGRGQKDIPF